MKGRIQHSNRRHARKFFAISQSLNVGAEVSKRRACIWSDTLQSGSSKQWVNSANESDLVFRQIFFKCIRTVSAGIANSSSIASGDKSWLSNRQTRSSSRFSLAGFSTDSKGPDILGRLSIDLLLTLTPSGALLKMPCHQLDIASPMRTKSKDPWRGILG